MSIDEYRLGTASGDDRGGGEKGGMVLLGIYSLGLAVPFMVLSIFINFLLRVMAKMKRAAKIFHPAAGILMIIMGLFLVTDNLNVLARI